jgi:ABC-type transporter Mla maintaining outer membrane lipid asymmetry ATPase subunit MlaF
VAELSKQAFDCGGMGMLFQNSALLTDFSVFENVAFPCARTPGFLMS